MPRTLTASDRSALIRLASTLPAGSEERRAILAGLSKSARKPYPTRRGTKVTVLKPIRNQRMGLTVLPGAVGTVTRVEKVHGGVDSAMLDYMGYNYDSATMDRVPGYKFTIKFDNENVKEQGLLEKNREYYDKRGLTWDNTTDVVATVRDFMDGTLKR